MLHPFNANIRNDIRDQTNLEIFKHLFDKSSFKQDYLIRIMQLKSMHKYKQKYCI